MDLENLSKAVEIKRKIDLARNAMAKLERNECSIIVRENFNDSGIPLDKSFIPDIKQMLFNYVDALQEFARTL